MQNGETENLNRRFSSNERANGQVEVQIFSSEHLGSNAEMLEMVEIDQDRLTIAIFDAFGPADSISLFLQDTPVCMVTSKENEICSPE